MKKKNIIKLVVGGIIILGGIVVIRKLNKSKGNIDKIYPDDNSLNVKSGKVSVIKKGDRIRIVEDFGDNGDVDFVNVDIPKGNKNINFYEKSTNKRTFDLKKDQIKEIKISGDYSLVQKLKTGAEGFDASVKIKGY